MGRLGNQLFQIACTLSLAKDYQTKAKFPAWKYNGCFGYCIDDYINESPTCVYKEPSFQYSKIVLKENNCDLYGFFQSEKYFVHNWDFLKPYFTPCSRINIELKQEFGELLQDENCSVHIRRTDYLDRQDYHNVLDISYYQRAMDFISKNTSVKKFIVFSDDIEWCKSIFLSKNIIFVNQNDIHDLCLMSMCTHNIIANSSFSWWGAYINENKNKIVIAPTKENWFAKGNNIVVDDLYCDNWTLL